MILTQWTKVFILLNIFSIIFANDDLEIENEDEIVNSFVQVLNFDNFNQITQSNIPWVVLITSSEQCDICQTFENILKESADAVKFANFGSVDLSVQENQKIPGIISKGTIPEIRIYLQPAILNIYQKDSWYREYKSLDHTRINSPREMKRVIQRELANDPPTVESLTEKNFEKWIEQNENTNKVSVIAISSKSETTPMLLSLARSLHGTMGTIGQFVNVAKDSSLLTKLETKFGKIESIPCVIVQKEDKSWSVLSGNDLRSARIANIVAYLSEHRSSILEKSETQEPSQKQPRSEGILETVEEVETLTLGRFMPHLFATIKAGSAETQAPPEWFENAHKSPGIKQFIVHCDTSLIPEGESAYKEICKDSGNEWKYYLREYSSSKKDRSAFESVKDVASGRKKGLDSIPDRVIPVAPNGVSGFLQMAMQTKSLPLLLFGNKPHAPQLLVSVAAVLEGLVVIGYRASPSEQELQEMGLDPSTSIPSLISFVFEEDPDNSHQQRVRVAMYDRRMFGKFTEYSLISFAWRMAYTENAEQAGKWASEHGSEAGIVLEGTPDTENTQKAALDDVREPLRQIKSPEDWKKYCTGESEPILCILGLVDGNPLNEQLEGRLKVFDESRKAILESNNAAKSKSRFMWIDATCQSSFVTSLGVDATTIPTVVAYVPTRDKVFPMLGGFESVKIVKFVTSAANGRTKRTDDVSRESVVFEDIDCSSLPSRIIDEAPDDDDSEDMLEEIRREAERERELREQMEREAEEENKKKKGKKKKKKKSKKSHDKDEL